MEGLQQQPHPTPLAYLMLLHAHGTRAQSGKRKHNKQKKKADDAKAAGLRATTNAQRTKDQAIEYRRRTNAPYSLYADIIARYNLDIEPVRLRQWVVRTRTTSGCPKSHQACCAC